MIRLTYILPFRSHSEVPSAEFSDVDVNELSAWAECS